MNSKETKSSRSSIFWYRVSEKDVIEFKQDRCRLHDKLRACAQENNQDPKIKALAVSKY